MAKAGRVRVADRREMARAGMAAAEALAREAGRALGLRLALEAGHAARPSLSLGEALQARNEFEAVADVPDLTGAGLVETARGAMAERYGQLEAARRDRAARAGKRARSERLRRVDLSLPGGEVPTREALSHQAIVALPVVDRARPRALRLSGELPRAVKALVEAGDLTPEGAAALAGFADDCRLAEQAGLANRELRERVQGGKLRDSGVVDGVVLDAKRRVRERRAVMGARLAGTVEAVMVLGVSLSDAADAAGVSDGQKARRSGLVSGMLIAAADLLVGLDGG